MSHSKAPAESSQPLISLSQSLGAVSFVSAGDFRARGVETDVRRLRPGDVFVAIRGVAADGHDRIPEAAAAGVAGVVVERPLADVHVPQCVVRDTRAAYSRLTLALKGNPQKKLTFAAVTGTNGKTTTTWLLRSILRAARHVTGLLGTIEYSTGVLSQPARLTTPDPPEVATLLHAMVTARATHCVLELSSHALDQRRCVALPLAAAAITNITQDHLDYHGDHSHYLTAKLKIHEQLPPGVPLILGLDDPGCRTAREQLPADRPVVSFGMSPDAQIRGTVLEQSPRGLRVEIQTAAGRLEVRSKLIGAHNVQNLLAATALAIQLDVPQESIRRGLESLPAVPGRMEPIECDQPFTVVVDYAHTPDGIRNAVAAARILSTGRVILVFGAGGDRDRTKRPLMAAAAAPADQIIVTSDNPRSEPAAAIIADICAGFPSDQTYEIVVDREGAIRRAVQSALPGDVVVVAGRGHETTQQIQDRSIGFDDRKVTRRLIRERLAADAPAS